MATESDNKDVLFTDDTGIIISSRNQERLQTTLNKTLSDIYRICSRNLCTFFYFGRWKIGVRKICGFFLCGGLDLGFILV